MLGWVTNPSQECQMKAYILFVIVLLVVLTIALLSGCFLPCEGPLC